VRDGTVKDALVPILQARAAQVEDIAADMGGPSAVTAMQRALIDGWLKGAVAADVEFARLARGETDGTPERLATFLNTARSHLIALALERREKPVTDISTYLKAKADRLSASSVAARSLQRRGPTLGALR
jgi:hypothetical protein